MELLKNLFFGSGIAHNVIVFSLVICVGVYLGKFKIFGISLGCSVVLFVGILAGHFGMHIEYETLHFMREFGLILFVFAIGLQVGPSFFSSFKQGGLKMNALAIYIVVSGVVICWLLHYISGVSMPTMVGIMSGAVTNTPGLGAATQTYVELSNGADSSSISLGYAVAYPMGVLGVIGVLIALRYIFRMSMQKEEESVAQETKGAVDAMRLSLQIQNPAINGKSIPELRRLVGKNFVISRICGNTEEIVVPTPESRIELGDKILVVTASDDADAITAFFGCKIDMSWDRLKAYMSARRILVTNSSVNGKNLGKLGLHDGLGFNVTRVNRAGIDLIPHENFEIQIGDRITVVGSESAINNIEKLLGNSLINLRHPNIIPLFLGILLGVLLGSIPLALPYIPQPVKLGLAGGPLVVAILLGRFGYKFKLATYMTVSSNLMLREIGISLFLAGVGLGAGESFVKTIIYDGGYIWAVYGVAITVIPTLTAGIIGRIFFKFDYFTLIGVISGSCTNPPALAYSNSTTTNDRPAVAYSTVYPLSMFMRVLGAQLLIIFFAISAAG